MITAILLFLKAFPELLGLLKPLMDAYKEHGQEVVHMEITNTFDKLKAAKTLEEADAALDAINSKRL